MKKLLVLIFAFGTIINSALATEQPIKNPDTKIVPTQEVRKAREAAFEKRLGLTEEQKIKARAIRTEGHKRMKPILDQIKAKKQEAEMVKLSRISVQLQEEKLAIIEAEIRKLEKQAMEIRKTNFKKFESILTREQKKTLKQMKKEGRKKYKATHPVV